MVRPPTAAATTGVPTPWASTATSPKDSLYDGTQTSGRGGVPVDQLVLRDRRHEPHQSVDAERPASCASESGAPARSRRVRRRPRPCSVERSSGSRRDQVGGGADHHVGRLQRLDPADEGDQRAVGGQTRGARARLRLRRRRKIVEVDTGMHHLDASRGRRRTGRSAAGPRRRCWRSSMSAAATTCSSPISAGHRLGGVALGERGVLDLRHRVHRVHQRDAPAVARQRPDLAAEPVVAVHEVVVAGRVVGLGAQHLARERRTAAPGSSRLVSPSNGPGRRRAGPGCRRLTSTTGGSALPVDRVKTSTSTCRAPQGGGRARARRRSCRPRRRCPAGRGARCAG